MFQIIGCYSLLVLIWSTTSLGIVWSRGVNDVWFSLLARLLLAIIFAFALLHARSEKLPFSKNAIHAYLPSALGFSVGISASYYALQTVPSGIMTVLWGATPILVALLEWVFLRNKQSIVRELSAALIGFLGLAFLFVESVETFEVNIIHLLLAIFGILVYASTAVWYKAIDNSLSPVQVATGSLVFALPVVAIVWLLWGASNVALPDIKSGGSLVYLALFGSLFAIILYSWLLKKVDASKATTTFFITPILALIWGAMLNGEQVTVRVAIGTGIVMLALFVYFYPHLKQFIAHRNTVASVG